MRRLALIAFLFLVLPLAAPAEALTIRDIIELTKAGVGEEVLLALVEVDRGVFAIDPVTIKRLKEAGVSERVIVALVRSGREPIPEEPAPVVVTPPEPPPPHVVVIDHEPSVREVMVPVPVYVPVAAPRLRRGSVHGRTHVSPDDPPFVPFQSGPPAHRPTLEEQQRKSEPVYWGYGGKLRPDAWKPDGRSPREK